jgi:hypothetical protein
VQAVVILENLGVEANIQMWNFNHVSTIRKNQLGKEAMKYKLKIVPKIKFLKNAIHG